MTDFEPIRILHLSDFHFNEKTTWDSSSVLGALADDIKNHPHKPDLIAVTGDIAHSGQESEYILAEKWFRDKLLPAAGALPPERLLLVPGNHDVDRKLVKPGAKAVQAELLEQGQDMIAAVLGDEDEARPLLKRHDAYRKFAARLTHQPMPTPWWGRVIIVNGVRLGIAGLCSSWMCRQDKEQGGLLVGRYQWNAVYKEIKDAQIRLAMLHHPLGHLSEFDGEELETHLAKHCAILLRGHLHKPKTIKHEGARHTHLELAAGCAYVGAGYPNSYQWIEIDPTRMHATIHFRLWQDHEWITDRNRTDAIDGSAGFDLAGKLVKPDKAVAAKGEDAAFLETYRRIYSTQYQNWELANIGAAYAREQGRPFQAGHDEMYIPLRLAEDTWRENAGEPIEAEGLLKRKRPLVIRGAAGSGKTTWMRHTFRALLVRTDAFPLMIELRRLAASWGKLKKQDKPLHLEDYLHDEWLDMMPKGYDHRDALQRLLTTEKGPRPVLLVDGWDELGALGGEVRRRLVALIQQNPRLLVAASSRPYGDAVPSDAFSFETLDIQPLTQDEIETIARNFYNVCYRGEPSKAEERTTMLLQSLERAEGAASLARTPLLLIMLLFISRTSILPDKRHQLYQRCVENLLAHLPELYTNEGVQVSSAHWCPADAEERLRVVAALAFGLQKDSYNKPMSKSMVVLLSRDEITALLPNIGDWTKASHRAKFLNWLVDRAGLLTDRSDGTLAFAHLSFQEFLAALHLKNTVNDSDRIKDFKRFSRSEAWWETLRLWAALEEKDNPVKLEPVCHALIEGEREEFWLAGALFADGLGEPAFPGWVDEAVRRLQYGLSDGAEQAARIWGGCRQKSRKNSLNVAFAQAGAVAGWFALLCLRNWALLAGLRCKLQAKKATAIWVENGIYKSMPDERAFAAGRLWAGFSLSWPGRPLECVFLRNWRSTRAFLGSRLQNLALFDASRHNIQEIGGTFLKRATNDKDELGQSIASGKVDDILHFILADLGHNYSKYFEYYFASDAALYFAHDFASNDAQDSIIEFASEVVCYFVNCIRPNAIDVSRADTYRHVQYLTRSISISHPANNYLEAFLKHNGLQVNETDKTFAVVELFSLARIGPRPFLARIKKTKDPLLNLYAEAARLSYQRDVAADALNPALQALPADTDPLWPALARHLARIATPADKALLEDLAAHPEKRYGMLSWGLRYYVRGDVLLADGSILTLNELCDNAGLPHLPYLEDRPPELDINWDEARKRKKPHRI